MVVPKYNSLYNPSNQSFLFIAHVFRKTGKTCQGDQSAGTLVRAGAGRTQIKPNQKIMRIYPFSL